VAGFAFLGFAIAGPSDIYAGEMFFAHMVQHLLIMMAAGPLLLAAGTMPAYMWAMPETVRLGLGSSLSRRGLARRLINAVTGPRFTLVFFVISLWGWHVPAAFDLALRNEAVHLVMHLNMFLAGMLFWWPIIGPSPVRTRLSYPQRLLYMLMAVTPTAVLAAFITMSNTVLYEPYLSAPLHFGLEPEENQRIGGLLMWIPGNSVYLGAMTVLFFKWFEAEEERSRQARRMARRPHDAGPGRNGVSGG
jgi:putative membrane protein